MEAYIRVHVKLERRGSIINVRKDIKLYVKTIDENLVRKLIMNYSWSELKTSLLNIPGLVTPSTVAPFSTVKISGMYYFNSETKQQWWSL